MTEATATARKKRKFGYVEEPFDPHVHLSSDDDDDVIVITTNCVKRNSASISGNRASISGNSDEFGTRRSNRKQHTVDVNQENTVESGSLSTISNYFTKDNTGDVINNDLIGTITLVGRVCKFCSFRTTHQHVVNDHAVMKHGDAIVTKLSGTNAMVSKSNSPDFSQCFKKKYPRQAVQNHLQQQDQAPDAGARCFIKDQNGPEREQEEEYKKDVDETTRGNTKERGKRQRKRWDLESIVEKKRANNNRIDKRNCPEEIELGPIEGSALEDTEDWKLRLSFDDDDDDDDKEDVDDQTMQKSCSNNQIGKRSRGDSHEEGEEVLPLAEVIIQANITIKGHACPECTFRASERTVLEKHLNEKHDNGPNGDDQLDHFEVEELCRVSKKRHRNNEEEMGEVCGLTNKYPRKAAGRSLRSQLIESGNGLYNANRTNHQERIVNLGTTTTTTNLRHSIDDVADLIDDIAELTDDNIVYKQKESSSNDDNPSKKTAQNSNNKTGVAESNTNPDKSIFDPQKSISNPHMSISNPHESIANPHKSIFNPHNSISNPHKSIFNPHKSISNPHKSIFNPLKSISNPHKRISNPHTSISNPHKIISNPHKSISNPHKRISNPHRSISNPNYSDTTKVGRINTNNRDSNHNDHDVGAENSDAKPEESDADSERIGNGLTYSDFCLANDNTSDHDETSSVEAYLVASEKDVNSEGTFNDDNDEAYPDASAPKELEYNDEAVVYDCDEADNTDDISVLDDDQGGDVSSNDDQDGTKDGKEKSDEHIDSGTPDPHELEVEPDSSGDIYCHELGNKSDDQVLVGEEQRGQIDTIDVDSDDQHSDIHGLNESIDPWDLDEESQADEPQPQANQQKPEIQMEVDEEFDLDIFLGMPAEQDSKTVSRETSEYGSSPASPECSDHRELARGMKYSKCYAQGDFKEVHHDLETNDNKVNGDDKNKARRRKKHSKVSRVLFDAFMPADNSVLSCIGEPIASDRVSNPKLKEMNLRLLTSTPKPQMDLYSNYLHTKQSKSLLNVSFDAQL